MSKQEKKAENRRPKERYDVRYPFWILCILAPVMVVIWLYLKLFHQIRITKDPRLEEIKDEPWVVLGNHGSYFDAPIMTIAFFPKRIHYVMSNSFMATWWGAFIIKVLQQIPKSQFFVEAKSVIAMKRAVAAGASVGLYPEGRMTLTGRLGYLAPAVGKLVKSFGIPVVAVKEEGVSLGRPLWAKQSRRGPIEVHCRLLLSREEIARLTAEEVYQRIVRELSYNDHQWQAEKGTLYKCSRPAEGLENLLHRCPACRQDFAMTSQRERLVCKHCGFTVQFSGQSRLQPAAGFSWPAQALESIPLWYDWQGACLKERLTRQEAEVREADRAMDQAGAEAMQAEAIQAETMQAEAGLPRQAAAAAIRPTAETAVDIEVLLKEDFRPRPWGSGLLTLKREGLMLTSDDEERPLPDGDGNVCGQGSINGAANQIFFPAGLLPTITGTLGSHVDLPGLKALYRLRFAEAGQPVFWMQAVEALAEK